MRPALTDERDIGGDALANRLEEREIRGTGQVPVLGIPDDEIKDGLMGREVNHGGMPDARIDADDLIGDVVEAQHGRAARLLAARFRVGGRGVLVGPRALVRGRVPACKPTQQQERDDQRGVQSSKTWWWGHAGLRPFVWADGISKVVQRGL